MSFSRVKNRKGRCGQSIHSTEGRFCLFVFSQKGKCGQPIHSAEGRLFFRKVGMGRLFFILLKDAFFFRKVGVGRLFFTLLNDTFSQKGRCGQSIHSTEQRVFFRKEGVGSLFTLYTERRIFFQKGRCGSLFFTLLNDTSSQKGKCGQPVFTLPKRLSSHTVTKVGAAGSSLYRLTGFLQNCM